MKVLLIDVPFSAREIGGESAAFKGVLNVIPALGLAYLAAVAEENGHEVRILDCARGLGWDAVAHAGRTFRPDVVGVNATTPTFANTVRTASILRDIVPEATIVTGGPHPTADPAHAAAQPVFDYHVLGEGERTFTELLDHLAGKGPESPDEIAGLAFRRNGELVVTARRAHIKDLDSLPLPARHLLPPLTAYHPTPASYRRLPIAVIMTSRGCPYRCTFCDRAVFGESFRQRSADDVMVEVEEAAVRYGAKEIRFFDDCLTLNKKRLAEICKELSALRPPVPWTCLTKANLVTSDMLRMMREAGCWQVLYGIESGDDRVLEAISKGTTVEENRRAVEWAHEAGIRVRADFLVGSPTETPASLENTLTFAKSLPIDFAHFNKFVPFPGTEMYRKLMEQGFELDLSGSSSTLDHDAMVYVPPAVPPAAYRAFLDRAYREFYFRPGYMARRLLAMRTATEFWGNTKGLFAIGSIG